MNRTKTFQNIGILMPTFLMVFAMVGCGGNQEEKKWEEDVTAIGERHHNLPDRLQYGVGGNQPGEAESQTAMLNAIDALEEDFNALKGGRSPGEVSICAGRGVQRGC